MGCDTLMLNNQNQSKTCAAPNFLFLRLFFAARGHPSFFLGVPRVFLHITCHLCTQMFCFKLIFDHSETREDARAGYSTVPHVVHGEFQMFFRYKKVTKSVPKMFFPFSCFLCDEHCAPFSVSIFVQKFSKPNNHT